MTKRQELRERQTADVLAALGEHPGMTAYLLGVYVQVPQPSDEDWMEGRPVTSAPLTLVMGLLSDLQRAGKVRAEPDEHGQRWYLTMTGDSGG